MLADAGVSHLFGNPGTTELPLNDALVDDPRIHYILGLQEVPVMAMADGYAMASRQVGRGQRAHQLRLGQRDGHALQRLSRGDAAIGDCRPAGPAARNSQEPILWGDMVRVARPWTKWAAEVERLEDLPAAVRRACGRRLRRPTGPVFLSLPIDLQMADASHLDLRPPQVVSHRVRRSMRCDAAEVLVAAKNPAILVGSRVTEAGAVAELAAVAERLGARCFPSPATRKAGSVFLAIIRSTPRPSVIGRRRSPGGWRSSTCSWWSAWICCANMFTTAPSPRSPSICGWCISTPARPRSARTIPSWSGVPGRLEMRPERIGRAAREANDEGCSARPPRRVEHRTRDCTVNAPAAARQVAARRGNRPMIPA